MPLTRGLLFSNACWIMIHLLAIIVDLLIVGLFLYSKLMPYKARLGSQFLGVINLLERIFEPILGLLRRFIKPSIVGAGLALDMSQIILLLLFLIIQKFIL